MLECTRHLLFDAAQRPSDDQAQRLLGSLRRGAGATHRVELLGAGRRCIHQEPTKSAVERTEHVMLDQTARDELAALDLDGKLSASRVGLALASKRTVQ